MSAVDHATLPEQPAARQGAAVRVWQGLRAVVRSITIVPRILLHWWRRSIQARVVIGVLSLSTVLACLAGWVLLHQVKDGLLTSQRETAIPQAVQGFGTARARLNASDILSVCPLPTLPTACTELNTPLNELVESLAPQGAASGDYSVIVIGPLENVRPTVPETWGPISLGQLDVSSSVPADLVAQIRTTPGIRWAYSGLQRTQGGKSEPALVVGRNIGVPSLDLHYGLIYVFPLAEQQDTLSVVERGLLGAGAILVVLLSTIAWLVTRQVITPVRLARRIAERLASGRLEERMHVRGEDDIARLGQSFNQMANGLQRQIRQLEELSRVQRRFVADVSHELRTPLTTVRMASDLLYEARDEFDAPTARSAELLQNELNRFEGLLTDLLEISRFDAGAALLEVGDVDVADVARQVVEAHAPIATARGSALRLSVPESPAVVRGDVRRVQRIVRNLVANAIVYGEGNDVEVTVVAEDAMVTLTVRDHGVGLKPGEENLVFNRFWRADPARARTRGGTGLGLSIAVEDTALHGGILDAKGRIGVGSVFRLILPRLVGGDVVARPLRLDDEVGSGVGSGVGGPYARYGPPPEGEVR
jgi:two-component system sensor histidine kinase MtrB